MRWMGRARTACYAVDGAGRTVRVSMLADEAIEHGVRECAWWSCVRFAAIRCEQSYGHPAIRCELSGGHPAIRCELSCGHPAIRCRPGGRASASGAYAVARAFRVSPPFSDRLARVCQPPPNAHATCAALAVGHPSERALVEESGELENSRGTARLRKQEPGRFVGSVACAHKARGW